ncbi:protein Mis18-alpha-like isoform X2 [Rhinoderma darwinii]|uniref:protein Mis18-alpha-like isoform X2 n=1 Tax=Rhinoderma darwinii TaxID=43563 RepID=UPI003F66B0DA
MAEAEISNAVTENPVLVLCSSCRVPLADSGDLVETPEGANVILVKAVTADVEIDEEKVVSTYEQDVFSYCFDNPHKQRTRMNQKSVNLLNVPFMETQLKKCRTVLGVCERSIKEIEGLFQSSGRP